MPFLDTEASSSRNRGRATTTSSSNKSSKMRQSTSTKKSPTISESGMDGMYDLKSGADEGAVPVERKVRTKPPSAMYEPPSPPSPELIPLPPTNNPSHTRNPTMGSTMTTSTTRKRPRMKIRYSTSESSDEDEERSSDEDEEPAWWTFTQRGMMKMKARSMRRREGGTRTGRVAGEMGDGEAGSRVESTTGGRTSRGVQMREGSHTKDTVKGDGVRRGSREKTERGGRRLSKEAGSDRPSSRRSSKDHDSSRRGSKDAEKSSSSWANKRHSAQDYFSSHQVFHKRSSLVDVSPGNGRGSTDSTPTHHRISHNRLLAPHPSTHSSRQSIFERRTSSRISPGEVPNITLQPPTAMAMQRSNSEPTSPRPLGIPISPNTHSYSPTADLPSPGLTTLVAEPEHDHTLDHSLTRPSNEQTLASTHSTSTKVPSPPSPLQRRPPNRQLTAPHFPKFLRPNSESQTDSETGPTPSPRLRARRRLSQLTGRGTETPPGTDSDAPTPTRPRRSRQGTRLRLNIPPPISQHFSSGWVPHAGSWQDALYGYYEAGEWEEDAEGEGQGERRGEGNRSRRGSAEKLRGGVGGVRPGNGNGRKTTSHSSPLKNGIVPIEEGVVASAHDGNIAEEGVEVPGEDGVGRGDGVAKRPISPHTPKQPPLAAKKPRRQKVRRYRTALIPPTPAGLGFTPTDREVLPAWKEGRVDITNEDGFDWGNGNGNGNDHTNEGNAERVGTGYNEKGNRGRVAGKRKKGYWWIFGKSKMPGEGAGRGRMVDEDFRKRLRRYIFLDARVTVWIRLINLAVVIALLALSVRIRMELKELEVPGLMGSSTTLIIAYSSLTILHNLTAIYREYTGKPIGLWDLRSKMLWVCLDLLFISLWSSAMSLSTNDYIATPLQCTPAAPWWRDGLPEAYAQLLESLKLINTSSDPGEFYKVLNISITPGDMISHTLGVVLPAEVVESKLAGQACRRQVGCIALSLLALGLYGGNMVLSLFRIFETVRRTANIGRAVMV